MHIEKSRAKLKTSKGVNTLWHNSLWLFLHCNCNSALLYYNTVSLIWDLILGIVGLPAVLFRWILCDDSQQPRNLLYFASSYVAQQIGLSLGIAADCWCRLVLWLVTFQQPMAFIRANGSLGSQPSLVRFVQYCKLTTFSDSYSSILHTTWWLYYVMSRWNHSKNNCISLFY